MTPDSWKKDESWKLGAQVLPPVQLEGTNLTPDFWLGFEPVSYQKIEPVFAVQTMWNGTIVTPEGEMEFHAGDYIVTDAGVTHAWPVKQDVFERTYRAVEHTPQRLGAAASHGGDFSDASSS